MSAKNKKEQPSETAPRPWLLVGTAVAALSLLVFFSVRATAPKGNLDGQSVEVPGGAGQEEAKKDAYEMAPDFTLTELGGKPFKLSDHKGKVVLIDFWATWCGPCRMAIPHLIELQDDYKKQGFTIVGVSLDQQGEAVVRPFYKAWKMNYPVVVDSAGEIAHLYGGIRSIPMALLVDRQGRVINGFLGYRPKEEIETAIKAALAKG